MKVDGDGRLIVRAPLFMSRFEIEAFIMKNSDWVMDRMRSVKLSNELYPRIQGRDGEEIPYLGGKITVRTGRVKRTSFSGTVLDIPGTDPLNEIERFYRSRAREILSKLTEETARNLGFRYKSVSITGARTRFGSCSGRDSINYSFRLIMYPEACLRYVVIHELCHTVEKNHSAAFWRLVRRAMPDCDRVRRYMKENGGLMNVI